MKENRQLRQIVLFDERGEARGGSLVEFAFDGNPFRAGWSAGVGAALRQIKTQRDLGEPGIDVGFALDLRVCCAANEEQRDDDKNSTDHDRSMVFDRGCL
ncbi:MAG: hypothetical protein ABW198_00565 [Pseudorhodoplanes sp.]